MKATKAQRSRWQVSGPLVLDEEYNRKARQILNDIAKRRAHFYGK